MSDLAGKTVFISGASRGIGKAIALGLAGEGANIAVAAKTAEPHPSLPGTVYSAAEEIEAAGGKALPLICDIRDEDAVFAAVDKTVAAFGGIDILINNASAISLTGTADTPAKRLDLMFGINARGTYVCTRACLPHLEKAANPHILVNSPPLDLSPRWFKDFPAYSLAKYGMSLLALGWAEEFRDKGIAVNCLWPRTIIATAAMRMIPGGVDISRAREPAIMADAARAILRRDARSCTGNFYIDERLLAEEGITDLDRYAVEPGKDPIDDFFFPESRWGQPGQS